MNKKGGEEEERKKMRISKTTYLCTLSRDHVEKAVVFCLFSVKNASSADDLHIVLPFLVKTLPSLTFRAFVVSFLNAGNQLCFKVFFLVLYGSPCVFTMSSIALNCS